MLRVLMVSSEVESLARTGGLGDVVEALSLELARSGVDVVVVTPKYRMTKLKTEPVRWDETIFVGLGDSAGGGRRVGILQAEDRTFPSGGRRRFLLVDDPGLFDRDGLYGDRHGSFGDNDIRFAVLGRAALWAGFRAFPYDEGKAPFVLHAHDWHAAFALLFAKTEHDLPAVFTIHNLSHQGIFGESVFDRTWLYRSLATSEILIHGGAVNLMKGATAMCDAFTTVSPRYAWEITTREGGFGLDGHLRAHARRLHGIVNGIDHDRFNPETDDKLPVRYTPGDWKSTADGKLANKRALAADLGIDLGDDGDAPLFGFIGRLTWQKGIDLLISAAEPIVRAGGRIAIVGQGESNLEHDASMLAHYFPGRVATRIAFDEVLARRLYAASDFFLVPSRFEPCGLVQLYAMRYGALPVVTPVGGLLDTVDPIGSRHGSGTGFVAANAGRDGLLGAAGEALALYGNRWEFDATRTRAMTQDTTWRLPGERYREVYERVVANHSS